MPIDTPRGLPFSVDTWSDAARRKRHHFLTHAHKDHLSGMADFFFSPIYCTRLTKILVRLHFPQLEDSSFVEIELGESLVINDLDGDFSVSAFDANHCPGAVMFLFEGEFGNVLHTGDCRLDPECVQKLPMKYINKKGKGCVIDYLFLDCTFGRCSVRIPSKQLAIQQVINCIWNHPNAPIVYLACDMLGQEDVLVQVSKAFGSKIYVDEISNPECFNILSLIAPEIISSDASSRFQLVEGFPKLNDRASKKIAEAKANRHPEPLIIRPSTQWYAMNDLAHLLSVSEAKRDECGVWHVCYSIHSSREELEWALRLLQPKWVISTTPPCRAMELDYVKKHCYKTRITHDDPIWKLFSGSIRKVPAFSAFTASDLSVAATEDSQASKECNIVNLKETPIDHLELKSDLSTQPGAIPITLFGRARLGEKYIDILNDEKEHWMESSENTSVLSMQEAVDANLGEPNTEKWKDVADTQHMHNDTIHYLDHFESIVKKKCAADIAAVTDFENAKDEDDDACASSESCVSYIGSSKNINANLRRKYRSMNVPVPRTLPSLVGIMSSIKGPFGSRFSNSGETRRNLKF